MTTSDSQKAVSEPEKDEVVASAWNAGRELPPGLPDPAVLARMASDFFTVLPALTPLERNFPIAAEQPQSIPALAETSANLQKASELDVSRLNESELLALPSTLVGASVKQPPP